MKKTIETDEKAGEGLSEIDHCKDDLDERQYQIGEEERTDLDIDWKNRVLCDDGNCIGVIGSDGYCKECGKRYEGPDSIQAGQPEGHCVETSPSETEEDDIPAENNGESPPGDEEPENDAEKTDLDLEWEQRKLCSDGSCIGVIGPDGFCKECGKPYEREA